MRMPQLALCAAFLLSSPAVMAVEETPMSIPGGTYVDVAKAKALHDQGALFVDARVPAEYADQHIKGALGVVYKEKHKKVSTLDPSDSFDLSKLPADKNKVMVFYCNGSPCWRGYKAAAASIKAGYRKVNWFRDGLPAWVEKGYATE